MISSYGMSSWQQLFSIAASEYICNKTCNIMLGSQRLWLCFRFRISSHLGKVRKSAANDSQRLFPISRMGI
jgi:hypothetical protein